MNLDQYLEQQLAKQNKADQEQYARQLHERAIFYLHCEIRQPRVGDWVVVIDRAGLPSHELARVEALGGSDCDLVFTGGLKWTANYADIRVVIPVEAMA